MTDQNQRISSGVPAAATTHNRYSGLSAGSSPQSEADEKSGSGLHSGGGWKLRLSRNSSRVASAFFCELYARCGANTETGA